MATVFSVSAAAVNITPRGIACGKCERGSMLPSQRIEYGWGSSICEHGYNGRDYTINTYRCNVLECNACHYMIVTDRVLLGSRFQCDEGGKNVPSEIKGAKEVEVVENSVILSPISRARVTRSVVCDKCERGMLIEYTYEDYDDINTSICEHGKPYGYDTFRIYYRCHVMDCNACNRRIVISKTPANKALIGCFGSFTPE